MDRLDEIRARFNLYLMYLEDQKFNWNQPIKPKEDFFNHLLEDMSWLLDQLYRTDG